LYFEAFHSRKVGCVFYDEVEPLAAESNIISSSQPTDNLTRFYENCCCYYYYYYYYYYTAQTPVARIVLRTFFRHLLPRIHTYQINTSIYIILSSLMFWWCTSFWKVSPWHNNIAVDAIPIKTYLMRIWLNYCLSFLGNTAHLVRVIFFMLLQCRLYYDLYFTSTRSKISDRYHWIRKSCLYMENLGKKALYLRIFLKKIYELLYYH